MQFTGDNGHIFRSMASTLLHEQHALRRSTEIAERSNTLKPSKQGIHVSDQRPRRNGSSNTGRSKACSRTPARSRARSATTCARRATGCRRARELLTVKCDVPLPLKVTDLAPRDSDRKKLAALFGRLGFRGWLKDVQRGADPPAAAASVATEAISERHYETLLTERDLTRWLERIARAEVVSISMKPPRSIRSRLGLLGSRSASNRAKLRYLPLGHRYPGAPDQIGIEHALAVLEPWLADPTRKKIGYDLKYDQHVLANHGIRLAGVEHDTLLEAYVLESHLRHDKETLAERFLGLKTMTFDEVTGKGASRIGFDQVDIARATRIFRRGRRRDVAAASRTSFEGRRRTRSSRTSMRRSSCPCVKCCFAWSVMAC